MKRTGLCLFLWLALGASSLAADPVEEALALFDGGRVAEATQVLEAHRERWRRTSRVYLLEGLVARHAGRFTEAIGRFQAGLDHSPAAVPLRLELAVTLSWAGRLAESRRQFERVLGQEPTNFAARLGRARVLGWAGKLGEARRLYRALVREDPKNREALLGLAAVERADLKLQRANALYLRVLEGWPEDAQALEGLNLVEQTDRWRFAVQADLQGVEDEDSQQAQAFELGVDLNGHWSLRATYRQQGLESLPDAILLSDSAASEIAREELSLATTWRPSPRSALSASLQQSRFGERRSEAFAVEGSHKLFPRLRLSAGGRTSRSSTGGRALLGFSGLSFEPKPSLTLTLHWFVGEGSRDTFSRAIAVGAERRWSKRWTSRLTASRGEETLSSFSTFGAEVRWLHPSRVEISFRTERFSGAFERNTHSLAMSRRF